MNKSSTNHTQKYSPELLGLFLGLHETSRLPPQYGWEFLSIRDWISLRLVSKRIRRGLAQIEYTKCRDGKDYLVPFPGFPGVLSTQQDAELGAGLFQHQLASLQAMYRMENPPPENCHFGALRGGILGDAPGLGKTITMLSLIASTAGVRPVPPVEFWGGDTNNTTDGGDGWNALRINPAGREHILKALKPIRNWVQQVFLPQSKFTRVFQQTQAYVSPPYIDSRFPTIRDFERYVIRQLRHFVPQGVLELFRQQVVDIRAGLDKRNRKLLKSPEGRRLVCKSNHSKSGNCERTSQTTYSTYYCLDYLVELQLIQMKDGWSVVQQPWSLFQMPFWNTGTNRFKDMSDWIFLQMRRNK